VLFYTGWIKDDARNSKGEPGLGREGAKYLGACLSSRILLDVGVELGFLMGHEQELSWVEDR